uniref:AAA-ATPase-like domain-containing protein n=1 Tax=Ignavibacterium album TaxID=591197 RepID=A0A832G7I3_9BACT
MKNPFIYGKIASGESFTDREEEQKQLIANFTSGINTIIISPRRWGKSSLVNVAAGYFQKKNPETRFCFIDLFNVRSEEDFYSYFTKNILKISFTKWEEMINSAKTFFKQISPKFNFGIDPMNDFSVSLDWNEVKKSPDDILNLPESISKKKKIKIIVCIDEFQNIAFFDDALAFQKKLRAHWQHHKIASYCFYGSKRHMLTELFEDKSMPFYKFGNVMFLEKISEFYWTDFIMNNFERTKKHIKKEVAQRIAQTMENHPYFVQQLAHTAWDLTQKSCTEKELNLAIDKLLNQHTILFQREVDNLTNPQINFLKALCENVKQFSSAKTLIEYKLGTSGNVNRIKESLVKKEILDITPDNIEFIDPLFKLWFMKIYLKL